LRFLEEQEIRALLLHAFKDCQNRSVGMGQWVKARIPKGESEVREPEFNIATVDVSLLVL
jgi:hypothetical protein